MLCKTAVRSVFFVCEDEEDRQQWNVLPALGAQDRAGVEPLPYAACVCVLQCVFMCVALCTVINPKSSQTPPI